MYVRCGHCLDYSRLPLGGESRLYCHACGRAQRLHRVAELGSTPHERFGRAFEYCKSEQIDLASAYSVLLGLLSLGDARALHVSDDQLQRHRRAGYDRGFRDAVKEGHLTEKQARTRGDRVVHASGLVHEHGLSMRDAFDVADNRRSLRQVLSGRPERPNRPSGGRAPGEEPSSPWRSVVLASVLVAAALLSVYWQRPGAPRTGSSALRSGRGAAGKAVQAVRTATEIMTDTDGRPTRVAGADPRTVLATFCRAEPAILHPVRTIPFDGDWTGVFRRNGKLYSIAIQQEDGRERWFSGDGTHPIATTAVERRTR